MERAGIDKGIEDKMMAKGKASKRTLFLCVTGLLLQLLVYIGLAYSFYINGSPLIAIVVVLLGLIGTTYLLRLIRSSSPS